MLQREAWTIVVLYNMKLEELWGKKKSVFQGKLSKALKLSNCIIFFFFAKHCDSPVISVPLGDNMFIGVCTCCFALCSCSKTFTSQKLRTMQAWHILITISCCGGIVDLLDLFDLDFPCSTCLPLLVLLLNLSKPAVPKGKFNLHTTGAGFSHHTSWRLNWGGSTWT